MTSDVRPSHQAVQCLQHQALALRVQRAGGLVQNQDGRVAQDGAGDGHALPLPAGQLHAAFADPRLIALRKGADKIVGVGLAGRLDHLRLRRARPAVGDVVAGSCRRTAARPAAPWPSAPAARRRPYSRASRPSIRMRPRRRFVEAQQQRNDRRFARPARPDQGDALAGLRRQVHAAQHLHVRPRWVAEGRRSRRPRRRATWATGGRGGRRDFLLRLLPEQFPDPLRGAERRAESDYTGRRTIPSPRPHTSCTA